MKKENIDVTKEVQNKDIFSCEVKPHTNLLLET